MKNRIPRSDFVQFIIFPQGSVPIIHNLQTIHIRITGKDGDGQNYPLAVRPEYNSNMFTLEFGDDFPSPLYVIRVDRQ